jgi:Carboxypeptidase regulatory-like domain
MQQSLRKIRYATFALAIMNALVCPAQVEQGNITGVVTDQSGASVAGAKVTVTNLDTQVTAATSTNSQGNYEFPFLPHGNYSVVAEKAGFSPERVTGISLRVGLAATINLSLAKDI